MGGVFVDFEKMSLDELKEYAKKIGLSIGNIGKDKLIEKIRLKQSDSATFESVINDSDLDATECSHDMVTAQNADATEGNGLLDSIASAIDDLDAADKNNEVVIEDLPIDTVIPVKSITFGGLTYKSRTNNAIFRWNQIGAIEYMTIAELNEMNNYKRDFLNRPLVILMDERAIRKFRLTKVYENVAKINDLKRVFMSDMSVINSTVDMALAVNMRDILISKISQMIKNRSLVDINVIRLLDKKLQYDFDELLEHVD